MSLETELPEADETGRIAGPVLHLRGWRDGRVHLAAVAVWAGGAAAPDLAPQDGRPVEAEEIARRCGARVLRWTFSLPGRAESGYRLGDEGFPVAADLSGDLRIAFVSCNGQEHGDGARGDGERNALWMKLREDHEAAPFHLLLQGGDQIYADEATRAHPAMARWPRLRGAMDPATRDGAEGALRDAFFRGYVRLMVRPGQAEVMARVPGLAMWDDHDICDGWGSLPERALESDGGRALFRAARDMAGVFQFGCAAGEACAMMPDPEGAGWSWDVTLPGLRLVAPDLRTHRRPRRVMGEGGWAMLERALSGAEDRVILLSTVPALGPRLSWVEAGFRLIPRMQKYEDDLRDQWQSRAHRGAWRRLLRLLVARHQGAGGPVTAVSGEIHLAARGEMRTRAGPLHQLVASGIAHPPPPAGYAWALGGLARFGEAPLAGHPIRMRPLPGRRGIHVAQRNYLVMERRGGDWRAVWELEEDGATPPLAI